MVLGESTLIALLGGLLGIAGGLGCLQMLSGVPAAAMLFPIPVSALVGSWLVGLVLVAAAIGFVSGVVPATLAARLPGHAAAQWNIGRHTKLCHVQRNHFLIPLRSESVPARDDVSTGDGIDRRTVPRHSCNPLADHRCAAASLSTIRSRQWSQTTNFTP